MKKESSLTDALRIIFTVLSVFIIILASWSLYLRCTFFSVNFWVKTMDVDDFIDAVIYEGWDYAKIDLEGYDEIDDLEDATEDFLDAIYDSDNSEYIVKCMIQSIIYGKSDFDKKEFKDMLEDSTEDFFDDYDFIDDEDEFIDDFADEVEDGIDEMADSQDDSMKVLRSYISFTAIAGIAGVVIVAAMFASLFIIHKNKGLPLRNLGISGTISQGLGLVFILFMSMLIKIAMEQTFAGSSDSADKIAKTVLEKFVSGFEITGLLAFGVTLVISIICIVAGCMISKRYRLQGEE